MQKNLANQKKPIIHNQAQLTPLYGHYRQHLCRTDSSLDSRLRAGAMRRIGFETLAHSFDVILLDAFGVLNLGEKAIVGAAERVAYLKKIGINFLVVSNNASQSPKRLAEQFSVMGFAISQDEILTSGMAVQAFVSASPFYNLPYYLVGTADSALSYAPNPEHLMVNNLTEWHDSVQPALQKKDVASWRAAKYVLLCSNRDYYGSIQQQQVETLLAEKNLPILLANPDLGAPNATGGMSAVAGYTAAQWVKRFNCEIWGIGKPFPAIFSLARQRFPQVLPERFLMVGDTLDTDILGGAAQGFQTCLTLSGAYAEEADNLETLCAERGIRPNFVVQSIAN